jgi:hypothetical protein
MVGPRAALIVTAVAMMAGCRAHEFGAKVDPSPPSKLCRDKRLGAHATCMPAERLEKLLRDKPLQIRAVRATSGGTSGARLVWLDVPTDKLIIRAKWKPDWHEIIVPSVPRDTIARLRAIDRAALERLAVVAQLRITEDGMVEEVEPTAPIDPDKGVRRGTDGTVQFGLTREEIDGVERRIRALLERVDSGKLTVF